jgi:ribosomal protein S18 acetylase RimI-like enzyme
MRDQYYNDGCVITLLGPGDLTRGVGWLITHVGTVPWQRGKGLARETMTKVLSDADVEGQVLYLAVDPDPGTDYGRLLAWYQRLGFRWVGPDDGRSMYRPPWPQVREQL